MLCDLTNAIRDKLDSADNCAMYGTNVINDAEILNAVEKENVEMLARIALSGNISERRINGQTLFHLAVRKQKLAIAEMFLRLGIDSSQGHTDTNENALVDAIRFDCLRTVQYCLLCKCDPCIKDMTGKSALHYAAGGANLEVIELLLERCDRISMGDRDYSGFSVIQWAIEGDSLDVIKLIMKYATAVDTLSRDQQAKTALHWAAHYGKAACCEELLKMQPTLIDLQDSKGCTAMHFAAMAASQETILVLAKFNPNLTLRDAEGKQAREYAKGGNALLIRIIESRREMDAKRPTRLKMRVLLPDISGGRENIPIPVINSLDDNCAPVDDFKK